MEVAIPSSNNSSALLNNSPAMTTTEVVPSPTMSSCFFAVSTSILAAGWLISISLMIVAPSLVTVTSPNELTNILSIPLGPKVVLTIPDNTLAAVIFILKASFFEYLSVPSGRIKIGWFAIS